MPLLTYTLGEVFTRIENRRGNVCRGVGWGRYCIPWALYLQQDFPQVCRYAWPAHCPKPSRQPAE